jgi:hypothetical protein
MPPTLGNEESVASAEPNLVQFLGQVFISPDSVMQRCSFFALHHIGCSYPTVALLLYLSLDLEEQHVATTRRQEPYSFPAIQLAKQIGIGVPV